MIILDGEEDFVTADHSNYQYYNEEFTENFMNSKQDNGIQSDLSNIVLNGIIENKAKRKEASAKSVYSLKDNDSVIKNKEMNLEQTRRHNPIHNFKEAFSKPVSHNMSNLLGNKLLELLRNDSIGDMKYTSVRSNKSNIRSDNKENVSLMKESHKSINDIYTETSSSTSSSTIEYDIIEENELSLDSDTLHSNSLSSEALNDLFLKFTRKNLSHSQENIKTRIEKSGEVMYDISFNFTEFINATSNNHKNEKNDTHYEIYPQDKPINDSSELYSHNFNHSKIRHELIQNLRLTAKESHSGQEDKVSSNSSVLNKYIRHQSEQLVDYESGDTDREFSDSLRIQWGSESSRHVSESDDHHIPSTKYIIGIVVQSMFNMQYFNP